MNELVQDIAFAWRSALKQPASSLLIVITLALGIGANSAMFSVAYHVLLAPLPYADGERLLKLEQNISERNQEDASWSMPTLEDFRSQNPVLEDVAGYSSNSLTLVGQGEPYRALAGLVTWNFFELFGIQPLHGRTFIAADEPLGAAPVLILSNELWHRKFGGDPAVVGKVLEINGVVATVVGVLPELPPYPQYNDIWLTHAADPYTILIGQGGGPASERDNTWTDYVFAKLRNGVAAEQARAELDTIAKRLAAAWPDTYSPEYSIALKPLHEDMVGQSRITFLLLLALSFLVILIACANVANLHLARLEARNQELAIREAIGANPGRIRRQLLTESMLYALVGAVVGLGLALAGLNLLKVFAAQYTALASEIKPEFSMLLFAFGLALFAGALSSAASLFGRRDINRALKEGGDQVTTSASGVYRRNALLVLQFAASFVLLASTVLIMFSLYQLDRQDTGYDPERVLAASMSVNIDLAANPQQFPQQIRAFGTQLMAAVEAIPEVEMAALLSGRPLLADFYFNPPPAPFQLESLVAVNPATRIGAEFRTTTEQFFRVMNIPLVQGREFAGSDDENSAKVAIVNTNFAERYFPNGNVLGQRIKMPHRTEWWTIVGVVGNVRATGLNQLEGEVVYYSYRQFPGDLLNLYVKSSADLTMLGQRITTAIHSVNPNQSVSSMQPLTEIKSDWLAPSSLRATLIALFGVLALTVTLSGVIGVVSYNINQRLREIGVHMAIGANAGHIVTLFMAQGFRVYLLGLLLGLLGMYAAAPFLEPLLYGVSAINPAVHLVSALALTSAVLVAMYVPARKAGAMNPMQALHFE